MNRKNIISGSVVIVLLALAWTGWYIFFKPHRSLENSRFISVQADSIYALFQQNEPEANARYLDKALAVRGKVASIGQNQSEQQVVVLESGDPFGGVACTLVNPVKGLSKGQLLTVRGFCSGYLTDVVLRDAEIIKP